MKQLSLLFLFSICSFYSYSQIKESAAVNAIFEEWNKSDSPGCALGIIKDGKLIYAKGYGMANLEYDIPNDANSVFRIGSTSKQFTAACIVLLSEQKQLKLEHTLDMYFPEFPDYAKRITIQNLLNHTSGIRDYLTISYLKGLSDDDYYEDEDILNWLTRQQELNFQPGEEFLYSNSGYWLLGQIVNHVSGMNMAEYAKQEIFSPLGMSNTHFHNEHNRIVKNRASGYNPRDAESYQISMTTLNMIGDGGIFTTINDIKKWDDAFYDHSVLSQFFWDTMTRKGKLNNGEELTYACGLDVSEYKGYKTISHGGAFVGFRAEMIRFPEEKLSVAIFANRGDANPTRMAYQVSDLFLNESASNNSNEAETKKKGKKQKYKRLKNKDLEEFSGLYWNDVDLYSRKLYVREDTLRFFRNQSNESALVPISKTEFKMLNVGVDVLVRFEKDAKGNQKMVFTAEGEDPFAFRKYEPREYNAQELKKFEGIYYSQELDVSYALKLEDTLLILYVNDKVNAPVRAIMTNLFANYQFGTFQFYEDSNGDINHFKLAAGRAKNLTFEKK